METERTSIIKPFAQDGGIICAGLPRTGTASLAKALEILGVFPVHHGLRVSSPEEFFGWGRAAWCNLPHLRKRRRSRPSYLFRYDALLPWMRADWDSLIGRHAAVTDLGSAFAKELILTYPHAKVILVERPLAKWMKSYGEGLVEGWFFGWPLFVTGTLGAWVGRPQALAARDVAMGYLGAESKEEAWEKMPILHREHHAMVRALTAKDRLLEFRLEDGWEPLCRLLNVAVPDEPFPHVNDKDELSNLRSRGIKMRLFVFAKMVCEYAVMVGLVGLALRMRNRGLLGRMVKGIKSLLLL